MHAHSYTDSLPTIITVAAAQSPLFHLTLQHYIPYEKRKQLLLFTDPNKTPTHSCYAGLQTNKPTLLNLPGKLQMLLDRRSSDDHL